MGWLDNWRKAEEPPLAVPDGMRDATRASVVVAATNKEAHRLHRYAGILRAEVARRSRVEWDGKHDGDAAVDIVVRLSIDPQLHNACGNEGYEIISSREENVVHVRAARERGVLFGVGRLLREMRLDFHISYASSLTRQCAVPWPMRILSRPDYAMRQHQVAYRPKTNAYDGFTAQQMCQEVLDLALFGCNGVELIPPGVDDALQSPHHTLPWLDMLREVSSFCDALDVDVSIWFPAFFVSYEGKEARAKAQEHWTLIFSSLARLDRLFVPGGDPGGRPAAELMRVVQMQASFLRERFFPHCELWVSSQYGLSFSVDLGLTEPWVPLEQELQWMDALHAPGVSDFLDGAVYGPWSSMPLDEFKAALPAGMPLRNYPDLCHVQTAQMPVCGGWDLSFAVTNGRESVNPRPVEMARVIADQAPFTVGCGCYSEGVNDDVNKYVWTALHWGDDTQGPLQGASTAQQLDAALLQYAALLCEQPRCAATLVRGIYALEQSWHDGDLAKSAGVSASQTAFAEVQKRMAPRHRRNWRLMLLLFRATHDAFLQTRLRQERSAETRAVAALGVDNGLMASEGAVPVLASGNSVASVDTHPVAGGTLVPTTQTQQQQQQVGMASALAAVAAPYAEPGMDSSSFSSPSLSDPLNVTTLFGTSPTVTHLYGQLSALAATLFQQVSYQLSVGYGGQHRQRGAYLDLAWAPLGDVPVWARVLRRFKAHGDGDAMVAIEAALVEARAVLAAAEGSGAARSDAADEQLLREACVVERFAVALRERAGVRGAARVVWYASFGDEHAHELPGCVSQPTRRTPVSAAVPPYRPVGLGEDPIHFTRPLVEFLDASNDAVVRDLHAGLVPRCWRSYLVPIWPRTSVVTLRVPLPPAGDGARLRLRVTYLGKDLNRHGGDWEELLRESQPTKLEANGVEVHSWMTPPERTRALELVLPAAAVAAAADDGGELRLTWIPKEPTKTTFRYVPLPIAELWLLQDEELPAKL